MKNSVCFIIYSLLTFGVTFALNSTSAGVDRLTVSPGKILVKQFNDGSNTVVYFNGTEHLSDLVKEHANTSTILYDVANEMAYTDIQVTSGNSTAADSDDLEKRLWTSNYDGFYHTLRQLVNLGNWWSPWEHISGWAYDGNNNGVVAEYTIDWSSLYE